MGIAISERIDSQGRGRYDNRYYILSRRITVQEFAGAVRGHWGIGNNLHWQLDVSFREDECRVCRDHGPANLSVIRRFARGSSARDQLPQGHRHQANGCAGNDEYREKVLSLVQLKMRWPCTELWTADRVAVLIERHFAITYHPEHVRKIIRRGG